MPAFSTYPCTTEANGGNSPETPRGAANVATTCAATPRNHPHSTGIISRRDSGSVGRHSPYTRHKDKGRKIAHCGSVVVEKNATRAIPLAPQLVRGVTSSSQGVR